MVKNASLWKRISIILIIVNIIAFSSTVAVSIIYTKNISAYDAKASKEYMRIVEKNWDSVQTISDNLIDNQKKVKDNKTLSSFSKLLTDSDKKLSDIQKQIKGLNVDFKSPENKQKHVDLKNKITNFIAGLSDYLNSINDTASKNPDETVRGSFETAASNSDKIYSEMNGFNSALSLNKLPNELFSLHNLTSLYEPIWLKKEAEEEKKQQKLDAKIKAQEEANEKKEQEELKAAQAQKEQKFKKSCKTIKYGILKRDADSMIGTSVYYKGKVFTVQANEFASVAQVNVTNNGYDLWTDQVWVKFEGKLNVIEDDTVEIWGKVSGTKTYKSQAGWDISVPSIDVKYYSK